VRFAKALAPEHFACNGGFCGHFRCRIAPITTCGQPTPTFLLCRYAAVPTPR